MTTHSHVSLWVCGAFDTDYKWKDGTVDESVYE